MSCCLSRSSFSPIHISGNMLGVVSEMRIIKYLQVTQYWTTGEHQESNHQFCTFSFYDCHVACGKIIQIWSGWPSWCHIAVISDPPHPIESYCRSINWGTKHKFHLGVHPFHHKEEGNNIQLYKLFWFLPKCSFDCDLFTPWSNHRAYILQVTLK